ncbi:hypothetical protein Tco_0425395, partial [Tanacetum coccineum]
VHLQSDGGVRIRRVVWKPLLSIGVGGSVFLNGLALLGLLRVSGVFSGVVAVNVETDLGVNSFALGLGPMDGATDCANMDTIRLR